MSSDKINVLVYSGPGTTYQSVQQVLYSFRRLLSPHYSITPITPETILKEPWQSSCALLVIPGGADLPYCKSLDGEGNRKIQQFIRRGGAFVGFCAGGYYGSGRCEFEPDNEKLAVVGSRELAFFPGTCRGTAFSGFEYMSEAGARAVRIKVETGAFKSGEAGEGEREVPEEFVSYYNGGGIFVDADKLAGKGDRGEMGANKVTVLARYLDPLDVNGVGDVAVVHMKVGEGNVVLTGPHPEFAGVNLDKNEGGPEYGDLVDRVTEDHEKQSGFLTGFLRMLGLKVGKQRYLIPKLTPIHLTAVYPEDVGSLLKNFSSVGLIKKEGERELIVGENDTFCLETAIAEQISLGKLTLQDTTSTKTDDTHDINEETEDDLKDGPVSNSESDRVIDYDKVVKTIYPYSSNHPTRAQTPYFNHALYYKSLLHYRSQSRLSPEKIGSFIMYGEVMTSTSTILDQNYSLLENLPNGLTSVATLQISARGRGKNAWISPLGGLVFSTVLKHPMQLSTQAPVGFIQYLTGMAIVEAIKTYDSGYQDMPVKLKWPNDIYAEDPSPPPPPPPSNSSFNPPTNRGPRYVKIGGILVTSMYTNNHFHLVIGCGINTTNTLPTTSLNLLLTKLNSHRRKTHPNSPPLKSYQHEKLLARILVLLEEYYARFVWMGFAPFEEKYYEYWMHTNQLVRLEMEGGARARVKGITLDHGLLKAEEVIVVDGGGGGKEEERKTGRVFTLQSDGNSFDFFNGLLKVKN